MSVGTMARAAQPRAPSCQGAQIRPPHTSRSPALLHPLYMQHTYLYILMGCLPFPQPHGVIAGVAMPQGCSPSSPSLSHPATCTRSLLPSSAAPSARPHSGLPVQRASHRDPALESSFQFIPITTTNRYSPKYPNKGENYTLGS